VAAASLRIGQLPNQAELGRDVGVPHPTVHRWISLLETSYLAVRLPAHAVNRTKRLIKSPFRSEYGTRARTTLLLHAGSTLEWRTPGVLAAPWWRVL
jgi:predicted AAA+ superfamily ATPase